MLDIVNVSVGGLVENASGEYLYEIEVTGSTYGVKEDLKNLGYTWNPDNKSWSEVFSVSQRDHFFVHCKNRIEEIEEFTHIIVALDTLFVWTDEERTLIKV